MSSTQESKSSLTDRNLSIHLISPEKYGLPKVSASQKLSTLDMSMPRLYGARWVLCFPLSSEADNAQIFESLKFGLAHTISYIPWIAGSIGLEEGSDPKDNRIQIIDSSGGVEFRCKNQDGALPSYSELKERRFPLSVLPTAQISPLDVIPKTSQPVMAAQANFIEGGLLLTVGVHHSACDASSFDKILSTWASNVANYRDSKQVDMNGTLSHDRTPLTEGISGARLAEFPEYILMPTPPATTSDVNTHQIAATPFQLPPMAMNLFYFSPASLASLKAASAAYSTNDALTAFVWRHVTLARNPPGMSIATSENEKKNDSALLCAVSIRDLANPPLPKNYLGNTAMACATERFEVATLTGESGLSTAATAIRKSLQNFDLPNRVPLTIGLLNSRKNPTDFKLAYNGFLGPDLSTTSWADIQVYENEWGGDLGKPESFRTPWEGADGAMAVFPRLKNGGLEVMIALENKSMERLLENDEFSKASHLLG